MNTNQTNPRTTQIEATISILLTLGTLISTFFVLVGGLMYLFKHGQENLQYALIQESADFNSKTDFLLNNQISFTELSHPLNLIQIGIMCLVATQVVRVFLLALFYLYNRDYIFTFISSFVLFILILSFIVK